ncbi:hypothetical protein VTK73DRAFT_10265 [Phialemonium thermophilum]|uniref:Uncharacterized protein n=1 Tax=Phialemonium thermophilum TaxID=223376 RepID=A0ABR3XHP4_9PEZI
MPSLSVLKRSARELIEPRNPRSSSTQQSQQSSWSDSGSQSTSAATTSGRSDEGFRTTTDAGTTSSVTTVRADRGASASGHGRERSGNGPYGSVSSSGGATPVKERRSSSKRELLHDLISRSRLMGKAALTPQRERGRGESSPSDRTTPQQSSTATVSRLATLAFNSFPPRIPDIGPFFFLSSTSLPGAFFCLSFRPCFVTSFSTSTSVLQVSFSRGQSPHLSFHAP